MRHSSKMDQAPEQVAWAVPPGLLTWPQGRQGPPWLTGSFCDACSRTQFPPVDLCPACLGPTRLGALDREGTIYSFTVVRVKPPQGLPSPYPLGYLDLKTSGLRVFALLDPRAVDQLEIGLPMRLVVGPLGLDQRGRPGLRPYFTPLPARKGGAHA